MLNVEHMPNYGIFLHPIFMEFEPTGPNFVAKNGPGKGGIFLPRLNFYENWRGQIKSDTGTEPKHWI